MNSLYHWCAVGLIFGDGLAVEVEKFTCNLWFSLLETCNQADSLLDFINVSFWLPATTGDILKVVRAESNYIRIVHLWPEGISAM